MDLPLDHMVLLDLPLDQMALLDLFMDHQVLYTDHQLALYNR